MSDRYQGPEREPVDNGQPAIRKSEAQRAQHSTRVSPRHLSQLTRQLIVDEFSASGDIDAVAKQFRIPVRTVDSVLHWHHVRLLRRTA